MPNTDQTVPSLATSMHVAVSQETLAALPATFAEVASPAAPMLSTASTLMAAAADEMLVVAASDPDAGRAALVARAWLLAVADSSSSIAEALTGPERQRALDEARDQLLRHVDEGYNAQLGGLVDDLR